MEKTWGHSRSGIDGLRPHLIRAQAGGGQRLQPVLCILCQASVALCRSNRLQGGPGGLSTTEGPEARDIE